MIANFGWMIHELADTPPENVNSLIATIAQAHSIFMAMLIGVIFSDQRKGRRIGRLQTAIAIGLSAMWAAIFGECWVGYVVRFNAGGSGGLIDQMNQRAALASFLVAGMLGYICGKPADREAGPQ
jgi:hypothetical protein